MATVQSCKQITIESIDSTEVDSCISWVHFEGTYFGQRFIDILSGSMWMGIMSYP